MVHGRHFMHIPGPTNLPDRVLRAMDRPIIDHRSPEFAALTHAILPKLRTVYGTQDGAIIVYPSSGTGAWEASLVNVLSPGARVLAFNYGHFSAGFAAAARNLGFEVDEVPLTWGRPLTADDIEAHLRADVGPRRYSAVLALHNETSTGVLSDIADIRKAMDGAGHDALLIVDAVSSLASVPFQFDEWRVDVCIAASQKGLMLAPGLGLLCVGPRALSCADTGGSPRNYFDWRPILRDNAVGFYPYTPATLLLFGLHEALGMLVDEEGLQAVYDRHRYLADGVRAAIRAWGFPMVCSDPAFASQTVTAVRMQGDDDGSRVISHARAKYRLSLGVGLGLLKGSVFRIGHLGALSELEVLGALAGIEMTLRQLGVQYREGGVEACQRLFVPEPNKPSHDSIAGLEAPVA